MSSHAASLSWDGTSTGDGAQGGAGTWDSNTTANWWNGSANVVWPNSGTDNDAVFGGTASQSVLVSGTVTVNDISIATGYKVGADSLGTILLNGATPTITTTGSSNFATIGAIIDGSAGLTKTGNITLELRGANIYTGDTRVLNGTLLIGGASNRLPTATTLILGDSVANTSGVFQMAQRSQEVAGLQSAGTGTGNRVINSNSTASTFTVNNTTHQTFGGILGGTTANDNNFAFTKSGVATLSLTNINTYTGATSIKNGTLALTGGNDRLLTTGSVVLGDVSTSGKLVLGDATTARNQTLAGLTVTGSGGSVVGAAAANSVLTFSNASGTNTFGGKLGGTGTNENNLSLTKGGAGTLVLSGANSYAGNTLFGTAVGTSTGVLRLANSTALGTGKLIINNGSTDTGTVELSGGINIANNIDFFGRSASNTAAIIRNVSGNNELSGVLSGGSNGANYNFHSDLGTLKISNKITTSVSGRTLNLRGVGAINISGTVENTGSGVIGVRTLDAGTYTLGGNNNYTGATTINAGTLSINTIKNYSTNSAIGAPTSGAIVMGNLGVTGTLIYTGIGDITNRTIQIGTNMPTTALVTDTGGAILQNDGLLGALTFNATNFNTATNASAGVGANRTLTLQGSNTGANTISGIIQDNLVSGTATGTATVAVAKAGSGTWVLSGNNTYTGGTTVSNGALTFLNTNAKPSSGTHAFAADTTLGLGVATSGSFFTSTDIDNAFSGTMTGNLSNVTVTTTTHVGIDTTAGDFDYSSSVSGNPSKGLAKFGANTLTLSGTNTYTGATQINQGKLVVGGTGSITSNATVGAGTLTTTPVATLGGTGSIGGNVTLTAESSSGLKNGGVLAPTAAASGTKLSVTGTTAFGAGSIFQWDMSATTPATDPGDGAENSGSYGQLAGTGTISGSNAVFMIVLGSGNAFADTFWNTDKTWNDVFTGAGATNSLSSIFSSIGGTGITYNSELSRGDVDTRGYFTLNGSSTLTWTAVPEPTTALAGILLTFGLLRRRRG